MSELTSEQQEPPDNPSSHSRGREIALVAATHLLTAVMGVTTGWIFKGPSWTAWGVLAAIVLLSVLLKIWEIFEKPLPPRGLVSALLSAWRRPIALAIAFLLGIWLSPAPESQSLAGWIRTSEVLRFQHEDGQTPIPIRVGGKDFDEQQLLGFIASEALEAAGADVDDYWVRQGGTTKQVRDRLMDGTIDLYYEYTGTALIEHLDQQNRFGDIKDPRKRRETLFREVRQDDEGNGITWFALGPANSTWVIVANQDAVEDHNPKTISDYAAIANNPGLPSEAATLCISEEFRDRADGLENLQAAYQFTLQDSQVKDKPLDAIPAVVAQGVECQVGVTYNNAGGIQHHNLRQLVDNLDENTGFFPPYNLAVAMRTEAYRTREAAYAILFNSISSSLTDETMENLNDEIYALDDPGPDEIRDVAERFLKEHGII